MVIITVAAAILVYLWTIGIIAGTQSSGGQQVTDQLVLQSYDTTGSSSWTLNLMNAGNVELTVSAVYVSGIPVSFDGVTTYPQKSHGTLVLDVGSLEAEAGTTYVVKVITSDGGVFPFSLICGSRQ